MAAFVVYLAVAGLASLAGLAALVHAARTPGHVFDEAARSKVGTILALLVPAGVGGIYDWLRVRPDLADARRTAVAPPRPDPWADDDDGGDDGWGAAPHQSG